MALAECLECKAKISDKANACPKCGSTDPFQKNQPDTTGICPECGSKISTSVPECPECGCPEPFPPTFDPSLKILIVDDAKSMRSIMKGLLKDIGFKKLDTAEDGVSALGKIKSNQYDLIISDWNMPNMSGYDLLKTIRDTEGYKTVPFMMVTAETEAKNIVQAIRAGVTDYIAKPFSPDAIQKKLKRIFK